MVYSQRTEEDAEAASRRSNAPYVHMASATAAVTLAQGTAELELLN